MSPWVLRLLMVCAALLFVGFGLVIASGYSGDNGGGSELVWRVGGLMVYASVPLFVIAFGWALSALTDQPAAAVLTAPRVTFPHAGPTHASVA